MNSQLRNVTIIAHVDHGKTTLVDALLRQSQTKLGKAEAGHNLIMDSNELERERGITIFSKNAAVVWRGTKINIIDTPGHADFGGEVERVLKLADGSLLLVDAKEGPMPQTRFVLKRALALGHKIIVVINKIDRSDARPEFALNKTFDLFVELGASDEAADFPVIYASGKLGRAGPTPDLSKMTDIHPLFEAILKYLPPPSGDPKQPLQMLVTSISSDNFKGRIATSRVHNGILKNGQDVVLLNRQGEQKKFRILSLMTFAGLTAVETPEAQAGDIVAVAGLPEVMIGETIADPERPQALPLLEIEQPMVKMTVRINDSPFAGREGQLCTTRQLRERLYRELETDMALRVKDLANGQWEVAGRGELHLAILLERLRREGYELQVSRPRVIPHDQDGQRLVPWESVYVEVPEAYVGVVIQKLGSRNGKLQNLQVEKGLGHLEFLIPTQGLFGYRNEFLTDAHGLGMMNAMFAEYRPDPGNWREREQGSLVVHESGTTNLYGLLNAQERGTLFVGPAVAVYQGQVVGQNARSQDLRVNVCKTKQLSNMRSKGEGTVKHFDTPRTMDLEDALEYIGDDELVEVTPRSIRLRKLILSPVEERKRERGLV